MADQPDAQAIEKEQKGMSDRRCVTTSKEHTVILAALAT
jgi:hypothetical protein